jgi:cell division septal protein FtsQ
MQTLDPGETGRSQTSFDAQGIAADRTKIEPEESANWHEAQSQSAEEAARRNARRFALLLMALSATVMIVVGVMVWLMLFA